MNVAGRLTGRVLCQNSLNGSMLSRNVRSSQGLLFAPQKRKFSFWTGNLIGSFTPTHGRPPMYYAYMFAMSTPLRIALVTFAAFNADLIEHVYYGYPPEDWYYKRPKFWRKRIKPFFWGKRYWRDDCDLLDIWCWKGIDPRDVRH